MFGQPLTHVFLCLAYNSPLSCYVCFIPHPCLPMFGPCSSMSTYVRSIPHPCLPMSGPSLTHVFLCLAHPLPMSSYVWPTTHPCLLMCGLSSYVCFIPHPCLPMFGPSRPQPFLPMLGQPSPISTNVWSILPMSIFGPIIPAFLSVFGLSMATFG